MAADRAVTFPKRIVAALMTTAALVALGFGGGAAYAYWTTGGTGSSSVPTAGGPATIHVIAVTGGNSPATMLSPGLSADLVLELNNPNPYAVTITSIAQSGPVSPTGGTGSGAACTGGTSGTTGVTVPAQAVSVVVASGPQVVVHISGGASMSTNSASGCQGASFDVPATVTVQR
jgi:hypothetical protein